VLFRSRTEITNYRETVQFLDLLGAENDDGVLFSFGMRMALKVLDRVVRITGATCLPEGRKITLKDLRSSMACDLLSKGWTTDEVNQRLGHKPSSREIDKYVNWLALDRHRPKKRVHEAEVAQLQQRLEEMHDQTKLDRERQRSLQVEIEALREQMERNNKLLYEGLRRLVDGREEAVERFQSEVLTPSRYASSTSA